MLVQGQNVHLQESEPYLRGQWIIVWRARKRLRIVKFLTSTALADESDIGTAARFIEATLTMMLRDVSVNDS